MMKHNIPDFHYAIDEDGCYWECGKENCKSCEETRRMAFELINEKDI